MNLLKFYRFSLHLTLLVTFLFVAVAAYADSARMVDCLDDKGTARWRIETCSFAYADKSLSDDDRGRAVARRASALFDMKMYEEAQRDAALAQRLAPENAEVLSILAKVEGGGLGKPERVIAALNTLTDQQAKDPKLIFERAMAYYRQQDFERALADIDQVVALEPDNVEAHRIKGQILTSMMRNEESVLAITEALRLQPGDAVLHMERAGPALVSGQFAMTRDDLNIAFASAFKEAPLWRLRGAAHYALGSFTEAEADFVHDIKMEPVNSSVTVWRFLADYRAGNAQVADAAKLAETMKDTWPSAVLAYLGGTGSRAAAEKQAKKVPELADTRRSQLLFFTGEWALLRDEDRSAAAKEFTALADGGVVFGYVFTEALGQPYTINESNIIEYALAKARLKEMAP